MTLLGGGSGSFPNSGGDCDGGGASSVAPGMPVVEVGWVDGDRAVFLQVVSGKAGRCS